MGAVHLTGMFMYIKNMHAHAHTWTHRNIYTAWRHTHMEIDTHTHARTHTHSHTDGDTHTHPLQPNAQRGSSRMKTVDPGVWGSLGFLFISFSNFLAVTLDSSSE